MCSVLAIIYTLFALVLPVLGYYMITRKDKIKDGKSNEIYEMMTEESRQNTWWRSMYSVIFLGRRLIIIGFLLFVDNYPFF